MESLNKEELDLLESQFANYLLVLIRNRVKRAIREQRFPQVYEPLSKRHIAKKKKNKQLDGFWRETGWLSDNIEIWVDEQGWNIGFKDTTIRGDGKSAVQVATALELGTKYIPARPLFTPIASIITKQATVFMEKFLEDERKDILDRVKNIKGV